MAKSLSAFIRQQLKIKGKTEHTGRGVYWCQGDISVEEMNERLQAKLPDWQAAGLVENVEVIDGRTRITFNKAQFDQHYRVGVFPTASASNVLRLYLYAIQMKFESFE